MTFNPILWLATVVLAVGGINWGLVGLFEFDLVAWLVGEQFGTTNALSRIVYVLVGASAIVTLAALSFAQAKGPAASRGQARLSSN